MTNTKQTRRLITLLIAATLVMSLWPLTSINAISIGPMIESTYPNPPGAVKLRCPWTCSNTFGDYHIIPEMCTEAGTMIRDIRENIRSSGDDRLWGSDSVYSGDANIAADGLWNWDRYQITTGIGWTGWWVGLANYCEAEGHWRESTADRIRYRSTVALTFTLNTQVPDSYSAKLVHKDDISLSMQGLVEREEQTITSPTFNSPYIYTDELADGDYSISLSSPWEMYTSVAPEFNAGTGWSVSVSDGQLSVSGAEQDSLFYELGVKEVAISRNGQNFGNKADLLRFLTSSDFFSNLGLSTVEAANSFNYVQSRLPEAENYYLTILSPDAVAAISALSVTPAPDSINRIYYAIYPSVTPVTTTGDLVYPDVASSGSNLTEVGEVIVDEDVVVFWE